MSKYKVGDVVKLRDDLECDKDYGHGICFVSSMNHLKRKPVVIEVCEKESCGEWYRVEDAYWNITDEMIEGLWEECKEKQDKLKLIDVLNMIAKGELKEGTKFVYRGNMYIWEDNAILNTTNLDAFDIADRSDLNMELELIEPPCEDEHIVGADKTIEPDKIEELKYKLEELQNPTYNESWLMNCIRENRDKLNEVIRKINKE